MTKVIRKVANKSQEVPLDECLLTGARTYAHTQLLHLGRQTGQQRSLRNTCSTNLRSHAHMVSAYVDLFAVPYVVAVCAQSALCPQQKGSTASGTHALGKAEVARLEQGKRQRGLTELKHGQAYL
eukprot:1137585-Pelagomonas_calceolata.AAC.6